MEIRLNDDITGSVCPWLGRKISSMHLFSPILDRRLNS